MAQADAVNVSAEIVPRGTAAPASDMTSSANGNVDVFGGITPTPTPTPTPPHPNATECAKTKTKPTPKPSAEVSGDADKTTHTPPTTPKPSSVATAQPTKTMATPSPSKTPHVGNPPTSQPTPSSNSSSTANPKPTRAPNPTPTKQPSVSATPKQSSTVIRLTAAPTKTQKAPTSSPVTQAPKTPAPTHTNGAPATAAPAPKPTVALTPKPMAPTKNPVTTPAPAVTTKAPIMDAIETILNKVSVRPTTAKPTTPANAVANTTRTPVAKPTPTVPATNITAAPAPTRKTPKPSTKTPETRSPSPTPTRKTPTLVDNITIKADNQSTGSHGDSVSSSQSPSSAPMEADSGVLVIRQTDEETPPPDNKATTIVTKTSLIIIDNASTTEFHNYGRGASKTRKPAAQADNTTGETTSLSADVITIGGRNRTRIVPGADVAVSAMTKNAHDVMRLGCCGFVIASMVLLVLYHTLALISPAWLPSLRHSTSKDVSWLTPNTWELLAVATFFQYLSSLSMLVLPLAPYYVVDFTDALSWTNFQFSAMGSHEPERRLDYVILMGVVAYADRLGIDEGKLLAYTTRCFFFVVGFLVVCFLLTLSFQRWQTKKLDASVKPRSHDATLCFLGLAVAVWSLSTFPLCTTSSHELSMELGYTVTGDITIVLFNIFVVLVGGLALLTRTVGGISTNRTMADYHFAVFGTLYADHRRETRYTFVVLTLFQLFTGAVVGGIQDNPTQLIALLVLHGILLFALVAVVRTASAW